CQSVTAVCCNAQCCETRLGGNTCCNGVCVSTERDPNNCGGCGNVCPADQSCGRKNCKIACCYGNFQKPPGGCGANPSLCCDGTVCDAGFTGACLDTGFPPPPCT